MSSEIDALFDQFRPSPFLGKDINLTPQEQSPVGPAHIEPSGFVQDGVIDFAQFATGIRPPKIVDALPTLPDTDWPQGSTVFLTTDEKLYRNTDGSTWSAVVDTSDLDGTITGTQIEDGAISTAKLAANAVTAAKIAAGTITANEIAANTITAGKIASGAIGTDELAANAVTAAKINTSGLTVAQVDNSDHSVVIGSSGITISNGKLTFKDANGSTVVDQYGFGASWLDFLSRLIYNGSFQAGSTSDIAVSETGSGTPTANYLASLSANLPYWVVAASGATMKIVSDSSAVGGTALQFSGSGTCTIYQDVPVRPGRNYRLQWNWKVTADASHSVEFDTAFSYRKSDHSLIGSEASEGLTYETSFGYAVQWRSITDALGAAPTNAAYVRIKLTFITPSTTGIAKLSDVTLLEGGFPPEVTLFDTSGSHSWTKPAGLKYAVFEAVGGGGGGGGITASSTAGHSSAAGGGGGGAYARMIVPAEDIGSSVSVTVGSGGSGGNAAGGGDGGASSVLDTVFSLSAFGGSGANRAGDRSDVTTESGGAGGTASTTYSGGSTTVKGIKVGGLPGQLGIDGISFATSGAGGGSFYGGGGVGIRTNTAGSNPGNDGTGYGGGGGGAAVRASSTNSAGGDGANGAVIITAFFE